jgi:hypothetical protein
VVVVVVSGTVVVVSGTVVVVAPVVVVVAPVVVVVAPPVVVVVDEGGVSVPKRTVTTALSLAWSPYVRVHVSPAVCWVGVGGHG